MQSTDHQRRKLVIALAGTAAAPAVLAQSGGKRGRSGEGFDEPATAEQYVAAMHLGCQAGDYLETAYEPAGQRNAVGAADFDVMRNEGGFDHVRIPANCAAHATVDGVISEAFLVKLDNQIKLALERFERVLVDPLHHYLQWKGDHHYDKFYDDSAAVAQLTSDQHAVRATAMWVQMAKRYQSLSLRLSFDLINEPVSAPQQDGFPVGLTSDQLNSWYTQVIAAIRATGGNNARRMIWLEPWDNRLNLLAIPSDAGPLGVSPHYYSPFEFTHREGSLTAAGLANFSADIEYAKRWGRLNRVPIWIGEVGVSKVRQASKIPRPEADRAEYTAHVRNVGLATGVPMCYWGYNAAFAQYDQAARQWLPGMRQAVSGLPQPYPVRTVPAFTVLKGGRMAQGFFANGQWPGFRWDPETGILTAQANDSGSERTVTIVFPEIAIESGQSWIVRALEFTGNWRIGVLPIFFDADRPNQNGKRGIDGRGVNEAGKQFYPYRPMAPGGFDTPMGTIVSPGTFMGVDLGLQPGSPGGQIRFACIRSV
ncbi:cellulase family glycosylhydrolase [Xylophilus rhododendri]|uniref:Cellulase family glycosylhydrolase n=1 Tax=Xylophilus rhododendri TaxID=2697032 RepID=A0A857J919_9BURK|nr:cellulase family glycosylhydrolase [Xylophilus rhododendri]QHI99549.1 cellulase family glycosylhydrolase [Xylophilus rhododendri]